MQAPFVVLVWAGLGMVLVRPGAFVCQFRDPFPFVQASRERLAVELEDGLESGQPRLERLLAGPGLEARSAPRRVIVASLLAVSGVVREAGQFLGEFRQIRGDCR
jgi:hypothetical protein